MEWLTYGHRLARWAAASSPAQLPQQQAQQQQAQQQVQQQRAHQAQQQGQRRRGGRPPGEPPPGGGALPVAGAGGAGAPDATPGWARPPLARLHLHGTRVSERAMHLLCALPQLDFLVRSRFVCCCLFYLWGGGERAVQGRACARYCKSALSGFSPYDLPPCHKQKSIGRARDRHLPGLAGGAAAALRPPPGAGRRAGLGAQVQEVAVPRSLLPTQWQ